MHHTQCYDLVCNFQGLIRVLLLGSTRILILVDAPQLTLTGYTSNDLKNKKQPWNTFNVMKLELIYSPKVFIFVFTLWGCCRS